MPPASTHSDRAAIVTGAASGIGRACAELLAAEGATVCVADLDGDGAERVAERIRASGGQAVACPVDVTDPESNLRLVEQATQIGVPLRIVHLNAGVIAPSTILDGDVAVWDRVLAVNLRGVYLGLRAVAPALRDAGGGSIVVTASVAGMRGDRGMASYVASKHGVIGLMRAAAAELADLDIRVNAVCPGAIDTSMIAASPLDREAVARLHPLQRIGSPHEVAELVSFLASDRASFMTGAAVTVDGGVSAVVGGSQADAPEGSR